MIKKNLTIKERVARIHRKYYSQYPMAELIDTLAYWWKCSATDIYKAINSNATEVNGA